MSTADLSGRRNRNSSSRYGHSRNRHHASSKYDPSATSTYQNFGHLPSSVAHAKIQNDQDDAAYTVNDFGIFVEAGLHKQRVHCYTECSGNSRQSDINVCDTTSWHKQFPEFNFHRTDDLKNRNVLVCDASIKVMTTERPTGADLSIVFDLRSKLNLAKYDALECSTRFFDNGKPLDQVDEYDRKVKHTSTTAEFYPAYYLSHEGLLRVKFGASFWAGQMQKMGNMLRKAGEEEQSTRLKYESIVRKELQYMTAAQDIFGMRDGVKKCFLTILWRFNQTRTPNEAGRMIWRVVDFGGRRERERRGHEVKEAMDELEKDLLTMPTSSSSPGLVSLSTNTTSSMYPSLPLDFTHQPFTHPHHGPAPLDLDGLGLETMTSDFSNPNSATAPSLSTDYLQSHSLPSLSHHSQDLGVVTQQTNEYHDGVGNEFDFNGGHIQISACLEPAINLGAYESYSTHAQGYAGLPSIADLDHELQTATSSQTHNHQHHQHHADSFSDFANLDAVSASMNSMSSCYATKPSWHHPGLIPQLENQAEQYSVSDLMMAATHADNPNVGVMDGSAGLGSGLWKLQSAFGEDTGVGAMVGLTDARKDSLVNVGKDNGGGFDGFAMLERERRDSRYRPY
ncbi:hypothetical protein CC80DRAFT_493178 [Byssothecium circinans]|uniref:Uncharacterized protein n=1 Tax=Byssothecium circinans TaxID=147558 RepID=A0A6A5TTB5_9PLEO|nr:hypothetical protein CC80DRAFT_493178 [Byssothecium circinans]